MFRTEKIISFLFFLLLNVGFLFSQNGNGESIMKINFIYGGENMYVGSPFEDEDNGFCVTKVEVNGISDTTTIKSSSFEIALRDFNFSFNDSVHVILHHHSGCIPKILNPECLNTHSESFRKIWVDTMGILHFIPDSTLVFGKNFLVAQYRWNKWITIGDPIPVTQKNAGQEYKMDVNNYLFGDTVWFCIFVPLPDLGISSKKIRFVSDYKKPPIVFDSRSQCNHVSFSSETPWELFDSNGKFEMKGFGKEIDYSFLPEEQYFTMNYENVSTLLKVNRCTDENGNETEKAKAYRPIILIYPNSTPNVFNISTGQEFYGCALTVEVFDLSGRSIFTGTIQGATSFEISLADFSDGVYFLRLSNGNEILSHRKIAIRH